MLSAATAPRDPAVPRATVVIVRALEILVFVGLPLVDACFNFYWVSRGQGLFDFRTFWQAGHDVLHGRSPYPHTLPTSATGGTFRPFVYPASAAYFMVPFALIPWQAAEVLWLLLGVAALLLTLRLLDVRDWRCYGLVFLWPAVGSALGNGSISAVLVCACAALWRFRSRPYVAAAFLSLLVVFKLYLWPLGVWLLATRRIRATALSVAMTAAATLAGWALIGFAGLRTYPDLLSRLSILVGEESYSPYAFFRSVGAGQEAARTLMFLGGAALLAATVLYARRSDQLAFVLAIGATFVFSPIVWPHYFVLIVVPIALASPEFGGLWLLPIAAWLATAAWSNKNPGLIGFALVVYGATLVLAARRVRRSTQDRVVVPRVLRPAVK
jgi:glycosyl transferase family 87